MIRRLTGNKTPTEEGVGKALRESFKRLDDQMDADMRRLIKQMDKLEGTLKGEQGNDRA